MTPEVRILELLLSFCGLTIFGCITVIFAAFFVGQEAAALDGDIGGSREIANLHDEIAALREDLRCPVTAQLHATGAPIGDSAAFDFGYNPSSFRVDPWCMASKDPNEDCSP